MFKHLSNLTMNKNLTVDKKVLSSPIQMTPTKGDSSSLNRSQSSSSKVKRRSRSKSPFRSFRWKRSSATSNGDDKDDEDEGICLKKINLFPISQYIYWCGMF